MGPSARPTASKPVIDSIIVNYGHPLEHPHDYFGALYLAKREDAQGIEMPSAIQNCLDAIERARARAGGIER